MLKKTTGMQYLFFMLLGIALSFNSSCYQKAPPVNEEAVDDIRLNQIGYYPNAKKKAVVVDSTAESFAIIDLKGNLVVYQGKLSDAKSWELAGEAVKIADFSDFVKKGSYRVWVEGLGYSHPFDIKQNLLHEAFYGSVKDMYYQRVSMPLAQKYAGKWQRPMAHPDDNLLFHPSSGRGEGALRSPGGWYDAGDYNKYIVNASFPLGQFFLLAEHYPNVIADNELNIPESGNGISDYLDELKYEMDWILTMQDTDGGLFHKLTTKNFEGMVMPHEARNQRYIVGKGTTATLDFIACAAQAYRVFKDIDNDYALKCLDAAKQAYAWALEHPAVEYRNPNDIATGEYGDDNFDDEWFWADAELFISTEDTTFLNHLATEAIDFTFRPGESWTGYMRFIGMFGLLDHKDLISVELYQSLRQGILNEAIRLVEIAAVLDYFQPINDFQWGSNSDVLNAAMIMAQAYRLEKRPEYLVGVQHCMDYILGNNAIGVSFLTGFGDKTPMFIHHRQSAADDIKEPVPGLLSGGPNSRLQDVSGGAIYPDNVKPMKAWVDQEPSYASNEICLNWNAPMTYILGFLEKESN